jgi:spermidine/putrescine transport system substrate-binding protein
MKIVRILLMSFIFLSLDIDAQNNVVNVYNWSNYISDEVLAQFTRETGIKVNYTTYDSNETLYSKLKANPRSGYDVIVPSTYYINRMRQEGMLQRLDKNKLPEIKNLNPSLLNKPYDPNNQYSIPYFWSATGIAVNTHYINPKTVQSWEDLWKPEYQNKLLLLDDVREVFSIALITLGYSPNDTNPQHIQEAYLKLKKLMPNVKLFNNDAVKSLYVDEDVLIGMVWNGDLYKAQQENPEIAFIYPKPHYIISIDSMAIPIYAPHLDNAHRFINFILRADIAKKLSLSTGYSSANRAAMHLMSEELRKNSTIYPDSATLKRSQIQEDVGKQNLLYEHYWELLKILG